MNGLHAIENPQSGNAGESPEMQRLRKEVLILCTTIILGGTPTYASADLACRMHVPARTTSALADAKVPRNIPVGEERIPVQNIGTTVPVSGISPVGIVTTSTDAANHMTSLTKNPIRHGTVQGAMSVERFMLDTFGTKDGWELLVDAGTFGGRGGDRVRKANRDLYRGHTYFLARSPEEADMLSKIIREKGKNGRGQIASTLAVPVTRETKDKKLSVPGTYTNSYVVTRPNMSEEENQFLIDISRKERYQDKGKMYHFRAQIDEFKKIANQVGIGQEHIPVIQTLMSHLAKGETKWNYGAFGPVITHKSSHRGHRAIGLTQIMPIYWARWSQKHFHTILEPTAINQEKLGFAQIAEYYKRYLEQGNSFKNIVNNLSLDWYGRIRVKGLIAPTQYQKEYVHSVFSDTDRVTEAEKILTQYRESKIAKRKSVDPSETQVSLLQVPITQGVDATVLQQDTVALTQERTNTLIDEQMSRMPGVSSPTRPIIQTVKENAKVAIHTPAVNDPLYFKGSEAIVTGMSKVIDLNKYLQNSSLTRESEKEFKTQLPTLGATISLCQRNLSDPANKTNLTLIVKNQIELGHALTDTFTLAQKVAPNSAFSNGIKETEAKIIKVLNFQVALDKSLKQKAEAKRQANIATMQLDSVAFAERALGLKAA